MRSVPIWLGPAQALAQAFERPEAVGARPTPSFKTLEDALSLGRSIEVMQHSVLQIFVCRLEHLNLRSVVREYPRVL